MRASRVCCARRVFPRGALPMLTIYEILRLCGVTLDPRRTKHV